MENIVQTFDSNINSILKDYIQKPIIIRGIVHLLLVLYVVRLAPQPPKPVLDLFENAYFRLFIFSLVLWTAQFSPSTSLLIALAFLVTMNYVNTGKVWELLENVQDASSPPSSPIVVEPEQALEAIQALAEAAAIPEAISSENVMPVAEIAAQVVSDNPQAMAAIQALAEQAMVPEAGDSARIQAAADIAVDAIVNSTVPEAPAPEAPAPEASAPEAGVAAIQALAEQAIVPEAGVPAQVQVAADIAVNAIMAGTVPAPEVGMAAVQALAEQAMVQEAGVPEKVQAAAETAFGAIIAGTAPAAPVPAPAVVPDSGCYPMRKYDMQKVQPQVSGRYTFEDYQAFAPSPQ